jgi:hypothetical protein
MGQKEIKLPTTAKGWAVRLTAIVKVIHEFHNLARFPAGVKNIARALSAQFYPNAPITLVEGQAFSKNFEGALLPRSDNFGEWGILYNSAISSPGRINFTLAHEFGHYFLHRQLSGDPIYCARRDLWTWDSAYGRMEAEANEFASFLLMPLDDFRLQTEGLRRPSVKDFDRIKDRYEVSLTAVILKWLQTTTKRAMIVISRDGFIDWSRSSDPLYKSGVFF